MGVVVAGPRSVHAAGGLHLRGGACDVGGDWGCGWVGRVGGRNERGSGQAPLRRHSSDAKVASLEP